MLPDDEPALVTYRGLHAWRIRKEVFHELDGSKFP